jgi:hypothetical protein
MRIRRWRVEAAVDKQSNTTQTKCTDLRVDVIWRQDRGAGDRVGTCCTACQLVEHDAYYSEDAQKVRREIMGALMRELPHTATTEHLLDVLEPGDHEVLLCSCGLVPLNAFRFTPRGTPASD